MNICYTILLISGLVITDSLLAHANDVKGSILIDEYGLNKLLPKHEVVLVKFDDVYPHGEKHDAFRNFAEQLAESPNIVVAQVSTNDIRNKENNEFAKKYGVEKSEMPAIRMFVKNQKEPIVFGKDQEWTENNLLKLVKTNTNVYLGLPGCLEKFDKLAKKFAKSKKKEDVLEEAENLNKKLTVPRDQDKAKNYIKIMKKIIASGETFVATENARVNKLLKDAKMDAKKKTELKERLNVLQSFETETTKTEL